MNRNLSLAFAGVVMVAGPTACSERASPPPLAAATPAGAGLSDVEKQAVFDKAAAAAEKNSKVTRRPRRFTGDSL